MSTTLIVLINMRTTLIDI